MKGVRFVTDKYANALKNSRSYTDQEIRDMFDVQWVHMKASAVPMPGEVRLEGQEELEGMKEYIFEQWKAIRQPNLCKLHTGQLQSGYPSLSVRLDNDAKNGSASLALHRVSARLEEGATTNWKEGDFVASHPCHEKRCLTCGIKEARKVNTHRNTCKAYLIVGKTLVRICSHMPRCRSFGVDTFNHLGGETPKSE